MGQRPTAWQFAQAWRNQRAQMAAKFLEQNEIAVNGFATAQYNNITGFVAECAAGGDQSVEGRAK